MNHVGSVSIITFLVALRLGETLWRFNLPSSSRQR
jgi:hypothetical protein